MEDEKEIEKTPTKGNGWEVVSLTTSAYAAAPGPESFESVDDNPIKMGMKPLLRCSCLVILCFHQANMRIFALSPLTVRFTSNMELNLLLQMCLVWIRRFEKKLVSGDESSYTILEMCRMKQKNRARGGDTLIAGNRREKMVLGSGVYAKRMVVNTCHHMFGRLASVVAKELLNKQKVVIVRCEEICLSGGLVHQKMANEH